MSKYILDLTGISPDHKLYGLKIQCRDGVYQKSFDIDECDMPRQIWQEYVDNSDKNAYPKMPFGLDLWKIPKGAKLIRIESNNEADNWMHMALAPKDATWFRALMADGRIHERCHFAEDLSGDWQPLFRGYFIPNKSCSGYVQIDTPLKWMPI